MNRTATSLDSKVLLITSPADTGGGSAYEHCIYDQLHPVLSMSILELRPTLPFLRFRKLSYPYQVLRCNTSDYDVIVTGLGGAYGGVAAKRCRRNILLIHHIDYATVPHAFVHKHIGNFLLRHLDWVDAVVTVANYWKTFLTQYIESSRIAVIHNSFDVERIASVTRQLDVDGFKRRFQIPLGKILLYAGYSTRNKGIERLMEYARDFDDLHVVTSGKKDIDCGSQHLSLAYDDYLRLLRAADASIFLSEMPEGWNRCAHEALLCGTPVIGRNSAGLGELIEMTGQYTLRDGDSSEKFRDILEEAIQSRERTLNAVRVLQRFDRPYFAKEWLSVLAGDRSTRRQESEVVRVLQPHR